MLRDFADFLRNHPFSLLWVLIVFLVYKIIINRRLLVKLVKTLHYLLEKDDKKESLFQYIIKFFNPFNWMEWCVD